MHGQKKEWNDKNAKKRNQAAESEAVDINLQWNTETYGRYILGKQANGIVLSYGVSQRGSVK